MLFEKRSTQWKHLRGIGLVPMDATCWVGWGEGINIPYSTGSSWRSLSIAYFHSLLLQFVIHWPLSPANYIVSWCWSCFVCSELRYEMYSGVGPSMYIYCVFCYHVIAAPYVRSVVMSLHTITLLMMIQNTQWTISSLYSLKYFSLQYHPLNSISLTLYTNSSAFLDTLCQSVSVSGR